MADKALEASCNRTSSSMHRSSDMMRSLLYTATAIFTMYSGTLILLTTADSLNWLMIDEVCAAILLTEPVLGRLSSAMWSTFTPYSLVAHD